VLTIPNLFTVLRLAGVPLFVYLALGPRADGWAVAVLAIGASSDWVDGFLARRLGQVSRLGELLDPLADRLYIGATVIVLTVREVVPVWFTLALLVREALLGVGLLVLRRYGYGPPAVHYVGKTATFVLLVALPTLLLAAAVPSAQPGAAPAARAESPAYAAPNSAPLPTCIATPSGRQPRLRVSALPSSSTSS